MPNVSPIQDDFSGGVISPRLQGRTRSAPYAKGLDVCDNFEITPLGSLEMRGGTQFISTTGETEAYLHTFSRQIGQDVVVVIGSNNVTLYDKNGQLEEVERPNYIVDPQFNNGLASWDNGSIFGGVLTPIIGYGCNLSSPSAGVLVSAHLSQLFNIPDSAVSYDFSVNLVIRAVGTVNFSGNITVRLESAGGFLIFQDTVDYDLGNPAPPVGTKVPFSFVGIPTVSQVRVIIQVQGNGQLQSSFSIDATDFFYRETGAGTIAQFPTPATWLDRLPFIQSCVDSALSRMIFTVAGGEMYELDYNRTTLAWTFAQFTPIPPDASATVGAIDWTDNWPATCTFHQGRLWLAGSPDNRSAVWASETFNYDNFDLVASPVGNSPLQFTLTSNGSIQWIEGLKFLLIGTDSGEVIGRSSGAVITSTDFDFPTEQRWGSTPIQPVEVANEVLFVTPDTTKVRSLFDGGDSTNGYAELEVTFIAESLTTQGIRELAYARTPSGQLSALMTDGTLSQSTYYKTANINAWYQMTMTDNMRSITTSNDFSGSALWVLVNRLDGTDTLTRTLYLERKQAVNLAGYNLDSYTLTSVEPDLTVIGLDHLNDYLCSIVLVQPDPETGEDALTLHPSQRPVGGVIQLESYASNASAVLVGLPYTATVKTLPVEGSNQAGTAQVQKRRYNEIFMRIYNSAFPKINGERPTVREVSTPMNISERLRTGDFSVNDSGYGRGVIEIIQDLPLPTKISALFGKLKGSAV
jgi:hypothetical protein